MRKELGELTDIAAVSLLLSVENLSVVDVGCGPGQISRELWERGAMVCGVEPDPVQARKNSATPSKPRITFIESRAESLPMEQGTVDGVFFFRSLHHVPQDCMGSALIEAARVLKPHTGFLYVVEPAMTGTYFKVIRPFHDETHVRNAAQAALVQNASRLFQSEQQYQYTHLRRYQNFEDMVAQVTGQTFNGIRREHVETEEVRALFESGRSDAGDYVFIQPMLLNFYRNPG